jgi:hypothetical protein
MHVRLASTVVPVVVAIALWLGTAPAQERAPIEVAMERYFAGVRTEGMFHGHLICAGEDLLQQKLPGCNRGEHEALLVMEGNLIAHLIGMTPEVHQQIKSSALHGKDVRVSGTLAEPWSTIFARDIREAGGRAEDSAP